jgi:hypothetical protein
LSSHQAISLYFSGNEAGLTLEQRHSVKCNFEANELKTVFELLLNKLQSNLSLVSSSPSSDHQLFSSILTAIEKILLWNFSSSLPYIRRNMESSTNVETIDWRPPTSWKELVFDQQLVEFFFHIYVTLKSFVNILVLFKIFLNFLFLFRMKRKFFCNFVVRYFGNTKKLFYFFI